MKSPFESLRMPPELACEFFALFSRFEFALKTAADGRFRRKRTELAEPAWRTFAEVAGKRIPVVPDSELDRAINYLNENPPEVQLASGVWTERPLHGDTPLARAIDAAGRTRNNLFHGGKYGLDSPDGRDEQLVRASITVLVASLGADLDVQWLFEGRA